MRYVFLILFLFTATATWASNPGEPLDCSDWVFVEPGYSCSPWVPFPCDPSKAELCWLGSDNGKVFDNVGWQYFIRVIDGFVTGTQCGALRRYEFWRYDGVTESLFAYTEERCNGTVRDGLQGRPGLGFDNKSGRMTIDPLRNYCDSSLGGTCSYASGIWIASISGFATTFDVLQTFEPSPGPLSFHVPYMPEGFQFADWFDTFYGDLATVGDWSQAQPLQCSYPATSPSVGDYLTVADTLPTPPVGQGRYYVTAVSYQGQRRYGRQASGGVLTGRDPALLPNCE